MIDNELKQLADKPLACMTNGFDGNFQELQETVNQVLPKLLTDEVQIVLENLRQTTGLYASDQTLTKHANEINELAKR
ncbi:unnamed protein product [Trichobilharzia regenti]|nr:unnamed protein product [Trichobilharzia regenti]